MPETHVFGAVALPILTAIVVLIIVAGGFWGADSRDGLGDERPERKVRWFVHSKDD